MTNEMKPSTLIDFGKTMNAVGRRLTGGKGQIISAMAGLGMVAMAAMPGVSDRTHDGINNFADTLSASIAPVKTLEAAHRPNNVVSFKAPTLKL